MAGETAGEREIKRQASKKWIKESFEQTDKGIIKGQLVLE